jgi:hypothetical protein
MKTHIISNKNAIKMAGVDFDFKLKLHSNCITCGNLTEKDCLGFSEDIANNKIDSKKWELLSSLLNEEWSNETGCSLILFHSETYEEAESLNKQYHRNLKFNITKWGEKSYILIKWYGSAEK